MKGVKESGSSVKKLKNILTNHRGTESRRNYLFERIRGTGEVGEKG